MNKGFLTGPPPNFIQKRKMPKETNIITRELDRRSNSDQIVIALNTRSQCDLIADHFFCNLDQKMIGFFRSLPSLTRTVILDLFFSLIFTDIFFKFCSTELQKYFIFHSGSKLEKKLLL